MPTTDSTQTENAQLIGNASVISDETRGNVLKIENEEGAKGVNYLKLPEDTMSTISTSGYTVAMWTNIGADTFEHSALFEADAAGAYPLTRIGANLIARINANAYSDVMVGSGFIWNDEDCRNAMFDDVAVYFGVLTAEEIAEIYQNSIK